MSEWCLAPLGIVADAYWFFDALSLAISASREGEARTVTLPGPRLLHLTFRRDLRLEDARLMGAMPGTTTVALERFFGAVRFDLACPIMPLMTAAITNNA